MTLQDFIKTHHDELVTLTRGKVAKRKAGPIRQAGLEMQHGVPVFLYQLGDVLQEEATRAPANRAEPDPPTNPAVADTAALHGHDLFEQGYSVAEVVHDYGDVCQAVTELAVALGASISVVDFHTLNRCLDNAIAAAVGTWSKDLETEHATEDAQPGASSDETLQRLLSGATVVFDLLRQGSVAPGGASGSVLGRNLAKMHTILDERSRLRRVQ